MSNLRRFASALCLGAVALPASALAQELPFPEVLPERAPPAPIVPPPVEPPTTGGASGQRESSSVRKRWYGWQVLIPNLVSDVVFTGGAIGWLGNYTYFSPVNAGLGVAIAGLAVHGISGPIVHLAHGHPLKALASFGLEAALPGAIFGLTYAAVSTSQPDSTGVGPFLLLVIGMPIAWTAGTTVDIAALSWEDPSTAKRTAAQPSLHVAPLMLPPLKVGAVRAPSPGGVSLMGTF
jgi:hypothetical protein